MIILNLPKDIYLKMCDPFNEDYDKAWRMFFHDYRFEDYLKMIVTNEFKKYSLNFDLIDDCIGYVKLKLCQRLRGREYAATNDNMAPFVIRIIRNLIIDWIRRIPYEGDIPAISINKEIGDSLTLGDTLQSNTLPPDVIVEGEEIVDKIITLLKKILNRDEWQIFIFMYESPLSDIQIANEVDVNVQKVYDTRKKIEKIFIKYKFIQ